MTSDTYVIYIDEKQDNPSHEAVKLAEKRMGSMIQHIAIEETLKRMKSKSTFQFILMKMNVKLGGLKLMNGNISQIQQRIPSSFPMMSVIRPELERTQKESLLVSNVLNAILRGVHEAIRTRKMTSEHPKFASIIATKRHANWKENFD